MITGTIVLLAIALAYATVTDLRYRRIPNRLTFPMLTGGLLLRAVVDGQLGLLAGAQGAGIALAVMAVPFMMSWVGAGDVKLAMVVGTLMGPDFVISSLLYAAIVAGAFAVFEILRKRQLVATVQYLFRSWYVPASSGLALKGKLPYAPAMAAGCAMALWPAISYQLLAISN